MARTNKERAEANVKSTQKEVDVAGEVIEIDVDAVDSLIKSSNNKRRKVSVSLELEEGVNSNDDDSGGDDDDSGGDVNLRISVPGVGGGASNELETDSTNDNCNDN